MMVDLLLSELFASFAGANGARSHVCMGLSCMRFIDLRETEAIVLHGPLYLWSFAHYFFPLIFYIQS